MMGLIVGEAADKHAGEATASVRAAGFDAFIKMLKDEDTIKKINNYAFKKKRKSGY